MSIQDPAVRPEPAPGAVAERARAALANLSPSEARAGRVLLEGGADSIRLSISDVAGSAGVGIGSVVRACQRLGFAGFQDAKIALTQDMLAVERAASEDDGPTAAIPAETSIAVLRALARDAGPSLRRATAAVDTGAFDRAVALLRRGRRILVLGAGPSAALAQDAAYWLATANVAADAPLDAELQRLRAGLLGADDVALVVSHRVGPEMVSVARAAHTAGAGILAVTSFCEAALHDMADVVLIAGASATPDQPEAMTSRRAHAMLLDALFVCLVRTGESGSGSDPARA